MRQAAAPGAEMANMAAALENPLGASAADVIALQQRYGNRAVQRLLQRDVNDGDPTPTAPTTRPRSNAVVTPPSSPPVTESSDALVSAPEGGPQAPSSEETIVPPQAIEQATQSPTPSSEGEGTTPTPSGPRSSLRIQVFGHNQKALPFLKKFMAEQNASRNYNFYFDAGGNKDIYRKYIADGAAQQVAVPGDVKSKLDELAHTQSWTKMAPFMNQARSANQEAINNQFLPSFEQSPYYDQFKAVAKDQPLLTRAMSAFKAKEGQGPAISSFGPQLPRQMALTRRTVGVLEQAIDRYTPYFQNGKTNLTAVGLPSDAREVERLFKQGQERHQRVVGAFTRRYATDKTFRPDRYGPFFAKLKQFTRLWVEYKALLKRE